MSVRASTLPALALLVACSDTSKPEETNEEEVITSVALSFAPVGGGDTVTARWSDVDGDGTPTVDGITLAEASDYSLTVRFLNELEDPAEDITTEVAAESDAHQVFFTGGAVAGPASTSETAVVTHAYADEDANGLPVGLENAIATTAAGSGAFVVTLRHLPVEGGVALKTAGLAEQVAEGGFAAIPGESDASVEFALNVE
jgi:hypothetical protein